MNRHFLIILTSILLVSCDQTVKRSVEDSVTENYKSQPIENAYKPLPEKFNFHKENHRLFGRIYHFADGTDNWIVNAGITPVGLDRLNEARKRYFDGMALIETNRATAEKNALAYVNSDIGRMTGYTGIMGDLYVVGVMGNFAKNAVKDGGILGENWLADENTLFTDGLFVKINTNTRVEILDISGEYVNFEPLEGPHKGISLFMAPSRFKSY